MSRPARRTGRAQGPGAGRPCPAAAAPVPLATVQLVPHADAPAEHSMLHSTRSVVAMRVGFHAALCRPASQRGRSQPAAQLLVNRSTHALVTAAVLGTQQASAMPAPRRPREVLQPEPAWS